jgi:hypothetical protein
MMLVGALGPEPPAIFFMKQGGSIATRAARDNTANAVDMRSIFIGNKSFVVVHGRIGVEHCLLPQALGYVVAYFYLSLLISGIYSLHFSGRSVGV